MTYSDSSTAVVRRLTTGARRLVEAAIASTRRALRRVASAFGDRTGDVPPATSGGDTRPTRPADSSGGIAPAVSVLSSVVAGLVVVSSLAGLTARGLYQEPASVAAMFRGLDAVGLLLAAPALLAAQVWAGRGSVRGGVVWTGMLGYIVYTYALYVFGLGFNAAFLVHVAVLALAIVTLVLALRGIDAEETARALGAFPRVGGGLLGLLALSLGGMWVGNAARFAVTGAPPQESLVVQTPAGIHLSYALDLTLVVPTYLIAAVLLWRGAPWGHVIGGAAVTSGLLQQVGYLAELLAQFRAGVPGAPPFDPVEPYILAVYVAAAVLLLSSPRLRHRTGPAAASGAAGVRA